MSTERLQKILARAGIASRRHAEELIRAGRVRVGGRVVSELGVRADPRHDRIEVDGKRVVAEPPAYIVLHKPRGVVSTLHDPEGRKTVADLVRGVGVRVVPVGRLDYHTSGVLLLTNDGDFASVLAHPRGGARKVYVTKVSGVVDDAGLERLGRSILIDGRKTQPAQVKRLRLEGNKTWLEITLREGRNRQVRRLGETAGFPVMRLARVEYAGVSAEGLRPGQWRHLSVDELTEIKRLHGVPKRVGAGEKLQRLNPKPKPKPKADFGKSRAGKRPARSAETRATSRKPSPSSGRARARARPAR